jgi:sortase A
VVTPTVDLAHAGSAARATDGFTSIVARVTDQLAEETVTRTDGAADGPAPVRVSRWDRPPAPHDWRFYVGTIGRILIAIGLLMFGFVAYQLWGTGIETARAQNELEHQFETLFAEPTADQTSAEQPTSEQPSDEQPSDEQPSDEQPTDEQPTDEQPTGEQPTGEQPSAEQPSAEQPRDEQTTGEPTDEQSSDEVDLPVAVDLSDRAVVQEPVPIERGDVLARLEIPRIGVTEYVVPGVTLDDLKKGPGHYPDSPLPGQLGNTAVAGHRTTYGAPFFDVDQLEAGDELIFTMVNGDRFVYLVTFTEVVSASSYHVVTTTDPNIAEATLTSCDPKYTARDRIVVHSVLDPEQSSIVGIPTFYELDTPTAGADDPIPGDDPVLSSDDVADDTSGADHTADEISEVESSDEPDEPDESDDAFAGADEPDRGLAADPEPDVPQPIDAFSQGWFGDRGAFPQIGLWAAVLLAVALLSYRVAKRFRRYTFGVLVGVVPFVVALYFFYQNVNRLLPPGI